MNSTILPFRTGLRIALAMAALCGAASCHAPCGPLGARQSRAKVFPVQISNLDWVEIRYVPCPHDPAFPLPCRLSLMGSGEIEFRTGRSPQVWDSLAQAIEDPDWDDLWTDRLHIGQEQMQQLYQKLVDAGLFPASRSRSFLETETPPLMRVNARIGRERILRMTSDRRLVGIVEQVLRNFSATAAQAKARQGS